MLHRVVFLPKMRYAFSVSMVELCLIDQNLLKTYPYIGNLGQLMLHRRIGTLWFTDHFESGLLYKGSPGLVSATHEIKLLSRSVCAS